MYVSPKSGPKSFIVPVLQPNWRSPIRLQISLMCWLSNSM
ncbi:Uncharacterised protein [Mycobacteroides abscessus subsp. abscessus]|nr:Uncharacterised protein [Mycobacteroides abscessus subsp. abscessus]